jgi:hypothetical protein
LPGEQNSTTAEVLNFKKQFLSLILQNMKKILLRSIALVLIFMSLSFVSKATNVPFYITLTDNCGGTAVSYGVYAEVYFNGVLQCSQQWTGVTNINQQFVINCSNLTLDEKNPGYEIKVTVRKNTNPPSTCNGHGTTGLIDYTTLMAGQYVSVTLE